VIDPKDIPVNPVSWQSARRIIRNLHPPIDLFEDVADPEDWPLLIAAEMKTNPRLAETIGKLDLVPPERRVSGPGASYLMAPFTHVSPERPSRFSDGQFGVLYLGRSFETALAETIHHHEVFMATTRQMPGWTSQFRELLIDVDGMLHDLRGEQSSFSIFLSPSDYTKAQNLGAVLRNTGTDGIAYPSVRDAGGECVALFHPNIASNVIQGRHLDYHWNGERVGL
jgi:hypothetical protein